MIKITESESTGEFCRLTIKGLNRVVAFFDRLSETSNNIPNESGESMNFQKNKKIFYIYCLTPYTMEEEALCIAVCGESVNPSESVVSLCGVSA